MKFEVGKKYKNKKTSLIATCIFLVPSGRPVLVSHDSEWVCSSDALANWEEYREPVKQWYNKYRSKANNYCYLTGPFSSKALAEDMHQKLHMPDIEYLGTVEIEF